jgi:hypothetical protein
MTRARINLILLSALCPSLIAWGIAAYALIEEAVSCGIYTCASAAVPNSSIADNTPIAIGLPTILISTISIISIVWLAWLAKRSAPPDVDAKAERRMHELRTVVEGRSGRQPRRLNPQPSLDSSNRV